MMSDSHDDMLARWHHLRQGSLFPWLREEVCPTTEALERLIIILDTIGADCRSFERTDFLSLRVGFGQDGTSWDLPTRRI